MAARSGDLLNWNKCAVKKSSLKNDIVSRFYVTRFDKKNHFDSNVIRGRPLIFYNNIIEMIFILDIKKALKYVQNLVKCESFKCFSLQIIITPHEQT